MYIDCHRPLPNLAHASRKMQSKMSYVFCLTIEKVNYVFSITSLIWIVEKYIYILGIDSRWWCPVLISGMEHNKGHGRMISPPPASTLNLWRTALRYVNLWWFGSGKILTLGLTNEQRFNKRGREKHKERGRREEATKWNSSSGQRLYEKGDPSHRYNNS